jgi:hypothetical protein
MKKNRDADELAARIAAAANPTPFYCGDSGQGRASAGDDCGTGSNCVIYAEAIAEKNKADGWGYGRNQLAASSHAVKPVCVESGGPHAGSG